MKFSSDIEAAAFQIKSGFCLGRDSTKREKDEN